MEAISNPDFRIGSYRFRVDEMGVLARTADHEKPEFK